MYNFPKVSSLPNVRYRLTARSICEKSSLLSDLNQLFVTVIFIIASSLPNLLTPKSAHSQICAITIVCHDNCLQSQICGPDQPTHKFVSTHGQVD